MQDWQVIDAEVRDIMLRVWGVEPIQWGSNLIVPIGRPSAIEQMRQSIEYVRQKTEPRLLELNAGKGEQQPNLNWLDEFVREHEEHKH